MNVHMGLAGNVLASLSERVRVEAALSAAAGNRRFSSGTLAERRQESCSAAACISSASTGLQSLLHLRLFYSLVWHLVHGLLFQPRTWNFPRLSICLLCITFQSSLFNLAFLIKL